MRIYNSLFRDNSATGDGSPGLEGDGGGIGVLGTTGALLTNCTIVENTADDDGGGVAGVTPTGSSLTAVNCLFWGNTDSSTNNEDSQIHMGPGVVELDYSSLEFCDDHCGGTEDDESDGVNPDFRNAGADDFRLSNDSPAIDDGDDLALVDGTGAPLSAVVDTLDIDGDGSTVDLVPDLDRLTRIITAVDRGAYEHPCGAGDLDGDINGDLQVDFDDLLQVLDQWGDDCGANCPPSDCTADVNDDCEVDFDDLLVVLSEWCSYGTPDLDGLLVCFGIDEEWDDVMADLETGSSAVQDDIICWIEHYDSCHCPTTCISAPTGCGTDPFGNH